MHYDDPNVQSIIMLLQNKDNYSLRQNNTYLDNSYLQLIPYCTNRDHSYPQYPPYSTLSTRAPRRFAVFFFLLPLSKATALA